MFSNMVTNSANASRILWSYGVSDVSFVVTYHRAYSIIDIHTFTPDTTILYYRTKGLSHLVSGFFSTQTL